MPDESSLQEVAPLAYSFIGGSFLSPYLARFEQAINAAAAAAAAACHDTPPTREPKTHYSLVRARNVGSTAILLLARDPTRLRDIQDAEAGFGAAEMGNKGAVGLRMMYDGGAQNASTELTFVATHLAAMEWNLPRRNANWAAIMRELTFQDPELVLQRHRQNGASISSPDERSHLLHSEDNGEDARLQHQLHDLSVFKPTSHLFVAGDLNYRISTTSPPPQAAFPSLDADDENYYPHFFPLDQLTRERAAGRTLHGLTEADVEFPPTYKYIVSKTPGGTSELKWRFAPQRYPSWTDRVLYLDLPSWVKSQRGSPEIRIHAYDALPVLLTSDHRPVFLRASVPLIPPSTMKPPTTATADGADDPRVRLPVEIDPEAWGRRAAARRREVLVGCSTFLWSTKEGAWIFAALLATGIGVYWLYRTA